MASEGVLLYHNDEHISSHIDEGQIYQASVQYAVGKDHLEVAWWGLQKMHARSGHLEVARWTLAAATGFHVNAGMQVRHELVTFMQGRQELATSRWRGGP
ncbi:hypothetical protein V6N11_039314 [Hibiscus sabdariffa]|uniref:Uncharacterized protein n=1 Tax=Hibiscus sabdariffa TaxID=183260 RepID=A0ABR2SMJ1_9ROSI